ncbi:MAG: NUDIX domain-containing protein [Balneola sp.]|nr:MAG: NUDIX domain-containing protein [Balneola sp.]
MKKLIDVYPYRMNEGTPEFLIFLRSSKKIYAHQWRMVGGKVREGETYWKAALRELTEETSLSPILFWTIPSINSFYEASSDQIHQIPAFAAELSIEADPVLDREHSEFKWVRSSEVDNYICWPEQKRLIKLTHELVVNDQILPEWQISA